jgi:MFS family permease
MPFVLHAMGGTEAHVGYAPAANSLGYMIALLLTGSLLGHLNVKRATRVATVLALLATGVMVLAAAIGPSGRAGEHVTWIWMMIVAGGTGGAAMALYWPFLMSWVSSDYEGLELNRRFGRYNGSWSGGALVGPLIGGWLVGINPVWPMAAGVACFAGSLVLLGFARNHGSESTSEAGGANGGAELANHVQMLAAYRWISRVALFCSWACFAIIRSQFALLFKGFGHSEPQFGVFLTIFAVCNFLALVGAGRWAFWHFRAGPLFIAQVTLLAPLLMVVYGRTLGVFYPAAVILGLAFGFAYSSHLYYGASASRKRSVRMAIHEIVISIGITVGAGTGGVLAKNVGAYAPYWFAIGTVGLGAAAQTVIYLAWRGRTVPR